MESRAKFQRLKILYPEFALRFSILFIFTILTFNSYGQVFSIELTSDSLVITDWEITNNPFDFGRDPLKEIIDNYNPQISTTTYHNRHVDNQIDTSFTLKINDSYFRVYKVPSENFITEAYLKDENLKTRHGLKPGITKNQFKEIMNDFELTVIPDYVRLQSVEIPESFEIYFKDDKINTIKFNGYSD